jgi:hypothetical protein
MAIRMAKCTRKISRDQRRADFGERLCAKSTKRFFDKLVNHFAALWRNLQKRKLILHFLLSQMLPYFQKREGII